MTIPSTAEALAANFDETAASLQRELDGLSNEFVNRYVVTVQDLPINISIVAGKAVATVVPLRNATSYFNFKNAVARSLTVRNGNGTHGAVCTLQHAYVTQIEDLLRNARVLRKGVDVLKLTEQL